MLAGTQIVPQHLILVHVLMMYHNYGIYEMFVMLKPVQELVNKYFCDVTVYNYYGSYIQSDITFLSNISHD